TTYMDPLLNIDEPRLLERQMWDAFKDVLGLGREEHRRAIDVGYEALDRFYAELRGAAREVLEGLEREDRLGIVVLSRPYHNDPGVCHEILDEFQKIGFPAFTMDSLPYDDDIMWRLFGEDVESGMIRDPFDIQD